MSDTPAWLTPGAKAVVLRDTRHAQSITAVTIDRVLKRDVVLSNGERFTQPNLRKNLGAWVGHEYLLPPDDVRVRQAREAIAERRLRGRVREIGQEIDRIANHQPSGWRGMVHDLAVELADLTTPTPEDDR